MKAVVALFAVLALAAPAAAQGSRTVPPAVVEPARSLRPFFVVAAEEFSAHDTFDAVFGQAMQVLWGGGVQVTFRNRLYLDLTVSRFQKTGERAFTFDGQGFPLGIPLDVKFTPLEATIGHRFVLRSLPRVVPYVGAGGGWYFSNESSDGDELSASHAGALAVGGVEFRLGRLVRLSTDVQYSYVPGIIGSDGLSKEAGEDNLGGLAGRFRLIFGR